MGLATAGARGGGWGTGRGAGLGDAQWAAWPRVAAASGSASCRESGPWWTRAGVRGGDWGGVKLEAMLPV
jgi:hypothetical protein